MKIIKLTEEVNLLMGFYWWGKGVKFLAVGIYSFPFPGFLINF